MVQSWPKWAQRHVVLGLDLQGGSHILLEVDTNAVRKENAGDAARRRAPRAARRAHRLYRAGGARQQRRSAHPRGRQCRPGARPSCASCRSRSAAFSAPPDSATSTSPASRRRLIRLTLTEPAIVERVRQSVDQSIQIIERRVNELGTVEPLIQREGTDRILVQVPGLQDPTRLKELLGKTAKLDFRMVDTGASPEQALQGRVPPEDELLYSAEPAQDALSGREARAGVGRRSHRRAAGLRPAHQRADRHVPLQHHRARANSRR